MTTWQQQLNCCGEQHVDLGPATLHQPQLWWPIHMGVQVRPWAVQLGLFFVSSIDVRLLSRSPLHQAQLWWPTVL